jgi:hypothetical protein
MLHIPVIIMPVFITQTNTVTFGDSGWKTGSRSTKGSPPLVTINNLNLGYVFGNEELGKPSILGVTPNVTRDWRTSDGNFDRCSMVGN